MKGECGEKLLILPQYGVEREMRLDARASRQTEGAAFGFRERKNAEHGGGEKMRSSKFEIRSLRLGDWVALGCVSPSVQRTEDTRLRRRIRQNAGIGFMRVTGLPRFGKRAYGVP